MGHAYMNPAARWDVLAGLAQTINAKTFVEVGCKEGRTTGFLLQNLPELRAIAIDPWTPVPNASEDYQDWDFAKIESDFWTNVGANKARCLMIRATSLEAAKEWAIDEADLVFIDAGHDYENALADIEAWWPLVKPGGYLCGHDYQHRFPGVMRAVAKKFPLLEVAICPDSVWVVQKGAA